MHSGDADNAPPSLTLPGVLLAVLGGVALAAAAAVLGVLDAAAAAAFAIANGFDGFAAASAAPSATTPCAALCA